MSTSIDLLRKIALKVYENTRPILGTETAGKTSTRGAGGDITMYIDSLAENTIKDAIEASGANLLFISEEMGEKYIGSKERAQESKAVLIVDPIDGSNNSARGIPYCSASIAYAEGTHMRDIIKAVIVNLYTRDIYWAEKGKGAFMNGQKVMVSNLGLEEKPFFEINIAPRNILKNLELLNPIISRFHRVRILGSTALSMCQVASGSMEAFLNLRKSNRLVDAAAGFLILKEAGGRIFSIEGEEIDLPLGIKERFSFIACNAQLESFLKQELIKM